MEEKNISCEMETMDLSPFLCWMRVKGPLFGVL